MLMTDLINDLRNDEGTRLQAYDDATGDVITPGYTLKGHPTIGTGRALDTHGISREENDYMLTADAHEALTFCDKTFPWFKNLDDVRKRALANMAFQMGNRLLGFHDFLHYVSIGNWQAAYGAGKESSWFRQTPERAERVLHKILSGVA